jgi:putative component of membrane protein insertase Oxa1/YidC/SpoIIIJ protein YidD
VLTSIDGEADEAGDHSTATQSSDRLTTQARDLVLYFYKCFHGKETAHPPSKAINQAIALIAGHGEELARYIVDFAHKAAPETKFQIQHFGGVLQYTSRAIEAHDAAQAKRKTREAIARCTICDQNGFITVENEMKYSSMTKCPHDCERILQVAQERGWTILNLPSSSAS